MAGSPCRASSTAPMKKITTTALILVLLGAVGWLLYEHRTGAGNSAQTAAGDESIFNFGVYGYRCGDGTEFTMSPTSDMSKILITPATSVERIAKTVLFHIQSTSGAKYESSGLSFLAHGETVQLSTKAFTTTCKPMQVPDEAPFNFGD